MIANHVSQMADLRAAVKRQLGEAAKGVSSGPTDLSAGLQRAAALLECAPGTRWLLIAAPLTIDPMELGSLPLEGVQIRIVFPEIGSVGQLRELESAWKRSASEQRSTLKILDAGLDLDRELL